MIDHLVSCSKQQEKLCCSCHWSDLINVISSIKLCESLFSKTSLSVGSIGEAVTVSVELVLTPLQKLF